MKIIVQDVINTLIKPIDKIDPTVDTLKFGDAENAVQGIVTTFIATQRVLEIAKSKGANLIITHEGVHFSHHDSFETSLDQNKVWQEKISFIRDNNMNIFRFHDYVHRYVPDGITKGLIKSLAWDDYVYDHKPAFSLVNIPTMSLEEVSTYIKRKLEIDHLRVIGNLAMNCSKVGVLVGYRGGGELTIPLYEKENLDLILYGEGPEWETPEYVRDSNYQGKQKALIVLGHAVSEEPGMKYIANLLQVKFPEVPVFHVPERQLFQIL